MAPTEFGGSVIDHYQLIQKIGEGGMGEVWLAEQKEPVRRRVALKLVKAGMNSREVIARFESERQALAVMNHPAIARVLDAGSTPHSAPYFVMEYVAGSPITTYCDEHKLNTRGRLELFIQVCDGVQHAHHKAIIHRDLKPTNILITEVDGKPVPKIIDFGVAKALTQSLSADAMLTRVGTLIGTPEYMSPEQANSSGEDIDTRTDVYSLGVVFYELVAGAPPLDFKKAALHDFLKKLREEEPSRPSASIRTRAEVAKTELANTHRTTLAALEREIRGDLDAIALKALEKERSRRYNSPADFAADIRRYLNNEAVLAVAPSMVYRASKFARRHRLAFSATAAFLVLLVAAMVVTIRQSIRANREAATADAVADFLRNDVLAQAGWDHQSGGGRPDPDLKVRTALDRAAASIGGKFEHQPAVEAAIRATIGRAYLELGLQRDAMIHLRRSLELFRKTLGTSSEKTLGVMTDLAWALYSQGDYDEARPLLRECLEQSRRTLGEKHEITLIATNYLGRIELDAHHFPEAEALFRRVLEIRRLGTGFVNEGNSILTAQMLATVYLEQEKYPEAEALMKDCAEAARRLLGPESPRTWNVQSLLAQVYSLDGKPAEAEQILTDVSEKLRRTVGPENPQTLAAMTALANAYSDERRYTEAEALHLKVLEMKRRAIGPGARQTVNSLDYIVDMYFRQGKYREAHPYADQLLPARRRMLGSDNATTMDAAVKLALADLAVGNVATATALAREAQDWDRKNRPNVWARFWSESLLGASLARERKFEEAEPLLLEAYAGLSSSKEAADAGNRRQIEFALQSIHDLYTVWGKLAEAVKWANVRAPSAAAK
jgi:non-specific serine/threonine protein kinase/serine/threonine-protein kinase